MSEDRLVAGIGFRRGTPPEAIVALIRRALAEADPDARLVAIATVADRAGEPAIREAAAVFGLVPLAVEAEALERVDARVPTRSARIERLRGVGSLAEAAALASTGEEGRLVVARIDDGRVTCALAMMGSDTPPRHVYLPPSAGTGGPPVSGGREKVALLPGSAPPSPDLFRGQPSAEEAGGRNASLPDRRATTSSRSERMSTPQIATQIP